MDWFDTSGDGWLETAFGDMNADGYYDVMQSDSNGDGLVEGYAYDTNYNGVYDSVMSDTDQDGLADAQGWDVNEDSLPVDDLYTQILLDNITDDNFSTSVWTLPSPW